MNEWDKMLKMLKGNMLRMNKSHKKMIDSLTHEQAKEIGEEIDHLETLCILVGKGFLKLDNVKLGGPKIL